ncbi:MAG: hypothetical protein P8L66_08200 [Rhodospirillaceae bacterium]|nr:hypothetical protein [Rhodospirillaceae bacterium]
MAYTDRKDLIRFLGDSAHDLSVRAVAAAPSNAQTLTEEAEELMVLRTRLLRRVWKEELSAQMPLPLSIKKAA